jgi:hypothetical protein
MAVDATAVIGVLVGFLVVGIIGTYVGDQMIQATNLSGTLGAYSEFTDGNWSNWTVPANVYSADFTVVGSGGGGGAGNYTTSKGGGAGGNGVATTYTIALTPGTNVTTYVPVGGPGGIVNSTTGTAGFAANISYGGVVRSSAGGTAGWNGSSSTGNGVDGGTGYSANGTTGLATNGTGGAAGIRGARGYGYGAGGPGGGAGAAGTDGTGGRGAPGAVLITYYTTTSGLNPLATSQASVVETFALGVLLCKIIVIVSIASIVFVLLQKTGLIPRFGD